MNENMESKTLPATGTRWRLLFSFGGVLTIAVGVAWIAVTYMSMALYQSGQPSTAIGYLQLFGQHQALAAGDWSLWIVADMLLIPATIVLYLVLRHTNKVIAIAGTALTLFFCIYDPLVSELQSLRLVGYSQGYLLAATDATRASIVSNADSIVNALPLMTFISYFISTIGIFLFSILMVKSIFRRRTAIFGIGVNVIALLGSMSVILPNLPAIFGLLFFISVPAVAFWLILVGAQMQRKRNLMWATAVNQSPR